MTTFEQIEQLKQKRLGLNKLLQNTVGTNHSEFLFNATIQLLQIDIELAKMEQMEEKFSKPIANAVVSVAETIKVGDKSKTTVVKTKTAEA